MEDVVEFGKKQIEEFRLEMFNFLNGLLDEVKNSKTDKNKEDTIVIVRRLIDVIQPLARGSFSPLIHLVDDILVEMYQKEEQELSGGIFCSVIPFSKLKVFIDKIGKMYPFLSRHKNLEQNDMGEDIVVVFSKNLDIARDKYIGLDQSSEDVLRWLEEDRII